MNQKISQHQYCEVHPCTEEAKLKGICYCHNRDLSLSESDIKAIKELSKIDEDDDILHADSNDYRERYDNAND